MKSFLAVPVALAALAAAAVSLCPPAAADPIEPYCFDQRLCDGDFGSAYYCPDTGGFVGPFDECSGLVTGPYAPGGLRPNEGLDR